MNKIELRVAAKAVIVNDQGKVLLVREAATGSDTTQVGKWGICGGRLETGEAFFDGLAREVFEEVGLKIEPVKPLYVGEWRPEIRGVVNHIVAIFMLCKAVDSQITLSAEHDKFAWIEPADYKNYHMMAPDDIVIETLIANK